MKKVFTLLPNTLLKNISLLLCLFFLFSQSAFSLEKITTNSTAAEIDLESIPVEKSVKPKSKKDSGVEKNVDDCSDQTHPTTNQKDSDKELPKKDELPSMPQENTEIESTTKNIETNSTYEDISISQNESVPMQETEKIIEDESTSKETTSKQIEIPAEMLTTEQLPIVKQDTTDLVIHPEIITVPQETLLSDVKPLAKDDSKLPLEDPSLTGKTILITEIQLDTSTSSHEEYVELYNTTDSDINLDDYKLKKHTSSKECVDTASTLVSSSYFSGTIKAHDYFIITHQDFSTSTWHDLTFSGKSYTIAKNSAITLHDSNDNIIDRVGFGDADCFDKSATQNPDKNESIERNKKDGKYVDTDNNKSDFHINRCPFPGNYLPTNLSNTIRLNEIYPDPCKKDTSSCIEHEEFIELYNPDKISLKGWKITDSSTIAGNIDDINTTESPFIKLVKDNFKFTLNNGGDLISLIAPDCSIISQVDYTNSQKGLSLNYGTSWYNATPTPGLQNVVDPRTLTYPRLSLNELLPNPSGVENTDEFIEIYNPNDIKVNLKNWILKDSSKTGSYIFPTEQYLAPKSFFTIYRKEFSFALNNSNETVSLIAPNEKVMSSISYKSSREDISYNYNHISKNWRWSNYLTPSKQNIFNNLPTVTKFDIDKNSYKNVYTNFKAKATDKDRDELKVRWDFGDGRKSYLWKTRHKYTKTGTYHGSLRIQDESEEIIKKFTITVKKYPKHKIKITKIAPNPSGKDSGVEYIVIKNESKEKINLQNWSIATGTKEKTLVNHPIYDKLILKPGKTKNITRKYTAISLPNKTGVIEIRRPNGSVADTQKYGNKNISIKDNSFYEEVNGVWTWTIPIDLEKQYQTQQIISQAMENEKIFSQQILENKVAINAVYNSSDNDSRDIVQTNSNLFVTLMQNMNSLLHKTIMMAQSFSETLKSNQVLAYSYTPTQIDLPPKPCEKPYLFTTPVSQKFDLCK